MIYCILFEITKITNRNLLLILILLVSALWQPSHHFLMHHGMPMNFGTHALVMMIPFLSILFTLGKANWNS